MNKYDIKVRAYHQDKHHEGMLIKHPFVCVTQTSDNLYFATHPLLGCGKASFTGIGAIDKLLADHGYYDINPIDRIPENGRGSDFGPVEVVVIYVEDDRIETHSTVRTFERYDQARAFCIEECKWESTVECMIPRTLDKYEGEHNATRLEAIRRREITPINKENVQ